ncbi:uncharacterized protein LOC142322425 [Lycorma delicatula]|uniref:uncharacterized protein LOC142322425 n=1 Tax=Lycorma delicatula TaxID=130591 RepID=UPI003F512F3F
MEKKAPNWILDRRDSGKLFWRRDSAGIPSENGTVVNRVKFRCDVEILEFFKSEEETAEDYSTSEDDDDYGWGRGSWRLKSKDDVPPPSSLVGGFCIAIIFAVLTYQWWFSNPKILS